MLKLCKTKPSDHVTFKLQLLQQQILRYYGKTFSGMREKNKPNTKLNLNAKENEKWYTDTQCDASPTGICSTKFVYSPASQPTNQPCVQSQLFYVQ